IWVGRFRDPLQQNRAELLECLSRPWCHMKTSRTSFEISQRLLRSFRIVENLQVDFGVLRRRLRDDPLKNRTDRSHPVLAGRCEITGRRKAETARETA